MLLSAETSDLSSGRGLMLGGVSFSCDLGVNLLPWLIVNGDVGCDNLFVEGIFNRSDTRVSASSNF